MSVNVSTFYWDYVTDLKGNDRLVVMALCEWCNEQGFCFPSVREIARRCQISDRGTQKILAKLVASGHIAIEPNQGTRRTSGSPTHRYHLLAYQRHIKGEQISSPFMDEPMRSPFQPAKGEQIATRVNNLPAKGERIGSPDPSLEPPIEPSVNNAPRAQAPTQPAPAKPAASASPSEYQAVVKAYQNEIGMLTPIIEEEIKAELKRSSPDWVIRAIGVAVRRNSRRWAYIAGILNRWHVEGFDGGMDNLSARAGNAAKGNSKSTGYGRYMAPAVSTKGQSIEDYADDPEYYAQLKAIYDGGSSTAHLAAD